MNPTDFLAVVRAEHARFVDDTVPVCLKCWNGSVDYVWPCPTELLARAVEGVVAQCREVEQFNGDLPAFVTQLEAALAAHLGGTE